MTENEFIDFLEDEISGLKEQRDEVFGSVASEVFWEINGKERISKFRAIIGIITEIKQYRKLGTVEECLETVEKTKPKRCIEDTCQDHKHYKCPTCGKIQMSEYKQGRHILGRITNNCENCGQKLEREE